MVLRTSSCPLCFSPKEQKIQGSGHFESEGDNGAFLPRAANQKAGCYKYMILVGQSEVKEVFTQSMILVRSLIRVSQHPEGKLLATFVLVHFVESEHHITSLQKTQFNMVSLICGT